MRNSRPRPGTTRSAEWNESISSGGSVKCATSVAESCVGQSPPALGTPAEWADCSKRPAFLQRIRFPIDMRLRAKRTAVSSGVTWISTLQQIDRRGMHRNTEPMLRAIGENARGLAAVSARQEKTGGAAFENGAARRRIANGLPLHRMRLLALVGDADRVEVSAVRRTLQIAA